MPLSQAARLFATAAHAAVGQRRKYTNEPYTRHPEAVAKLVASVPHTDEMLAAAWLHDVVENTAVSLDDIAGEFGSLVASLVADLTDVSKPSDGNREAREAIDRAHSAQASPSAQTIKLADLIDNTRSIVLHDPGFARNYLREKAALLEVMRQGDLSLHQLATETLEHGLRCIEYPPSQGRPHPF